MSESKDGISANVQRHLAVAMALAGNEFDGIRNVDIAQACGLKPYEVTGALKNLIEAGWAEKLENGMFRLGPKPVQVAIAFATSRDRAQRRLDEITQRFTRQP